VRPVALRVTTAVSACCAALLTAACDVEIQLDGQAPSGGPLAPPAALGQLRVAPESHADSYERDAFGQSWKDIDRNGCGQRDDVLARDLSDVRKRNRCVVVAGTLVDPYTGQRVTFAKADAQKVQIDHRVALAEAWRSGAWQWTGERREQFANDLNNLAASEGSVNQGKGDDDAARWLPVGPARQCTFARQVVTIKVYYGLTADQDEATALRRALGVCPGAGKPAQPSP
jgi:hypothetical protein